MIGFEPLLAAGWQILGVVVFVVIWVISQVIGNLGNQARRNPQAGPQPRPPGGDESVANKIEAFLRRAAGRRGSEHAEEVNVAPDAETFDSLEPEVEVLYKPEYPEEPMYTEGVAEHVGRHMDSSEFVQRASHLNDNVTASESRLDSHLDAMEDRIEEKFDHRLGSLARQTPSAAPPSPSSAQSTRDRIASTPVSAAGIAAMLSSGESLKQAIIMKEILDRPEQRW